MRLQLSLGALLCAVAFPSLSHAGMIVDSEHSKVYTGVVATPGQVFQITAIGQIEMAVSYGPYQTNPDGTILALVPYSLVEWNVHQYMLDEGGSPVVGGIVNISSRGGTRTNDIGQLIGSPFGSLIGGFSSTQTPTTLSDFVNGFTNIGSSGSITAPVGAPYLFLSINDTDRSDNVGSYDVTVSEASSAPEPASMALLGLTGLGGLGLRWRQQRRTRGAQVVA